MLQTVAIGVDASEYDRTAIYDVNELHIPRERGVKEPSAELEPDAVLYKKCIGTQPKEWPHTIAVGVTDVLKVFL